MFLKALSGAVAMTVLATTAATAQAAPSAPAVNPWAGLYYSIGGNIGEAFGGNKVSFQDLSTAHDLSFSTQNDNSALLGGAQLGQLWLMHGLALGLEGDVSFAKNIKYLSSLRAMLGVPTGSFLIYGTGGIGMAITQEQFAISSPAETDKFQGATKKYGWVAGAGIQALVTPRVSVGVEALYYGLGRETTPLQTVITGEPFNMIIDRNFAVVRARIDYHFASYF